MQNFPMGAPYGKITDTPIEDYTILVFSPAYTGSQSTGIVTLPEERRIICLDVGTIK